MASLGSKLACMCGREDGRVSFHKDHCTLNHFPPPVYHPLPLQAKEEVKKIINTYQSGELEQQPGRTIQVGAQSSGAASVPAVVPCSTC
jgi:hypothetical protein